MSGKRLCAFLCTVLAGLGILPASALSQKPEGLVRIGVFDSRCVAIAHGRSAIFAEYIRNLRADLARAKEAGNKERVKELERIGPTAQVIMHQQGFSTGSVRDVLLKVADRLPAIARKAGVRAIVSKWELMYQDEQVEVVDITDELVGLFSPDAQTLKILAEVKKMDPIPLEQISLDPRE